MMETEIRAALGQVMDPCSVAAGRPTSLLDMGLVPGWALEGSTLTIRFGVTFAGCTMAPHFVEAARVELLAVPGIEAVEAVVDTAFAWQPEMMAAPPPMRGAPQAWRQSGVSRR